MNSHAQAAQDQFVAAVLKNRRDGQFLEIGCCEPIRLSNTYALEQELGWKGLMVDNDPGAIALCQAQRKSDVVMYDVTSPAFRQFLEIYYSTGPKHLGFLSLDVDSASLDALKNLPQELSFDVITAEHDFYRFGPGPRDAMRHHFQSFGYILVCSDVRADTGEAYEDWLVSPRVPVENYERFLSSGLRWPEIIARI